MLHFFLGGGAKYFLLPSEVVAAVEGKEAGDGREVDVGPDVARVGGVLGGYKHRHAREDGQGGEEEKEHTQHVLPALGEQRSVLDQGDAATL